MTNKIKPRRSYTANSVPLTTDLDTHELAINWVDGKAFTKNAAGQIVSVTLGGGGGSGEDTALRAYFLPPAPTSVTATAGNAQAVVTWTAPTVLSQTPITDYVVQYSSNSGSTWTTFADGTSTAAAATVTGLTNGTAYTFRVAAVNGVGQGEWSTASASVTPIVPVYWSQVSLALLMNGENNSTAFTDISASPKTITNVPTGGVKVSTASSKFGGASAFFNGSSYLSTPQSSAFDFGTGDFTVEMWVYPTSSGITHTLCGKWQSGNDNWLLRVEPSNNLRFFWASGSVTSSSGVSANTWQHVAVVRSGTSVKIYLNGSEVAASSTGQDMTSNGPTFVGAYADGVYPWNGYIDDFVVFKGLARYTSNFTPLTSQFPN